MDRRKHTQAAPAAPVSPSAVLDRTRFDLALQAIYQTDAMIDMLKREDGNESFDLVLRASLPRLKQLTSVLLSVLGDDAGRATEEMEGVVHG